MVLGALCVASVLFIQFGARGSTFVLATLVGVLFGKLMEVTASTNRHFTLQLFGESVLA